MKELTNTGGWKCTTTSISGTNHKAPRIYDAFVDVWGTEKLWVTIDRANLNFRCVPTRNTIPIHWDYDGNQTGQCAGVLALG